MWWGGRGRGWCWWFFVLPMLSGYYPYMPWFPFWPATYSEKEYLERQRDYLKKELEYVEERLRKLEAQ